MKGNEISANNVAEIFRSRYRLLLMEEVVGSLKLLLSAALGGFNGDLKLEYYKNYAWMLEIKNPAQIYP